MGRGEGGGAGDEGSQLGKKRTSDIMECERENDERKERRGILSVARRAN